MYAYFNKFPVFYRSKLNLKPFKFGLTWRIKSMSLRCVGPEQ